MKYRLQLQGRWTNNASELVDECRQIKEGLASYGLTPIGYDPGVIVVDSENASNSASADIPLWLLKRLLARATSGEQT